MSTWFPLLIEPALSADGDVADTAVPDFSNNRVVQLTSFWTNAGNTTYDDWIFVSSSVDGTYTASARASAINVISGNGAYTGANGGRASRLGTDGRLYVISSYNAGNFSDVGFGLSKINVSTLTEVAFMTPSVITSSDDPVMVAFQILGVNYIALMQDGVVPNKLEVINVDTMTSVGSITVNTTGSLTDGFILGGTPSADSVEFFLLDSYLFTTVRRVVYDVSSGLSVSTIAEYQHWNFDYTWTDYPIIGDAAYDPGGTPGIVLRLDNVSSYVVKLSTTGKEIYWQNTLTDAASIDYFEKPTQSVITNQRLLVPLDDGVGTYQFINTETGQFTAAIDTDHLIDLDGTTVIWDGVNNKLVYYDRGINDEIPPTWYNGWAIFDTPWIAPATAALEPTVPSTYTTCIVVSSGSTFTVPSELVGIWGSHMALDSALIHCVGGGQAGFIGAENACGLGGKGADYAGKTTNLIEGFTYDVQIGVGGTSLGEAGTETWFKDDTGTKIAQAGGGDQSITNIGDVTHDGGESVPILYSWDGSYGFITFPVDGLNAYSASGGGGAAGPNSDGADSGDSSWAVGAGQGSGGGGPDSPYPAPGLNFQVLGYVVEIGDGGSWQPPPSTTGDHLFLNPNGVAGAGGAIAGNVGHKGGDGSPLPYEFDRWVDSYTYEFSGPGGGGGGAPGGQDNQQFPSPPGHGDAGTGGRGGPGGGGGGGGGWAPAGPDVPGSPLHVFIPYTGGPGIQGAGGDGVIAVFLTYVFSDARLVSRTRIWGNWEP